MKIYQGPAIKHENFHHPKMEGYSIAFMDGPNYTGFYVWDYEKKDMHYIWKKKLGGVDWKKMSKSLERVATQISKGKLPKGNPNMIEKHHNT